MTDQPTYIMSVTVGLGPNNTVEINTAVNGALVSTVHFTREQAVHHVEVLNRHIAALAPLEMHVHDNASPTGN